MLSCFLIFVFSIRPYYNISKILYHTFPLKLQNISKWRRTSMRGSFIERQKQNAHLIYLSVLDPIWAVWQMIRLVIKPVIYKEILILVKVSRLWLDGSDGGCLTLDGWSHSPVVILIGVSTVMDVVILIRVSWVIDEMGCDSGVSELAVRRAEEAGSSKDRTWNGHFTWQRSPTSSTHASRLTDGRDTAPFLILTLSFFLSLHVPVLFSISFCLQLYNGLELCNYFTLVFHRLWKVLLKTTLLVKSLSKRKVTISAISRWLWMKN